MQPPQGTQMPIYECKCMSCGHEFELQTLPNAAAACPSCQDQNITRQYSTSKVDPLRDQLEETRQAYKDATATLEGQVVDSAEKLEESTQILTDASKKTAADSSHLHGQPEKRPEPSHRNPIVEERFPLQDGIVVVDAMGAPEFD